MSHQLLIPPFSFVIVLNCQSDNLVTSGDWLCLSDNELLRCQDEKLKKLVELHGSDDWKLIASLLTVISRCSNIKDLTSLKTQFFKMSFCLLFVLTFCAPTARTAQTCSASTGGRRFSTRSSSKAHGPKRRTKG